MRILVIGAGPTGLTLALALRRRGIAVRLVDEAEAPSAHSKALAVQARTLEVLDRLGLSGRVLEEAAHVTGVAFHPSSRGAPVLLDFPAVHQRFPPAVLLPQSRTEALLLDALGSAGAGPERGVACTGLDGTSAALLRHPDSRLERAEADWIIGCDGAHSAVRHAIGAAFLGEAYPQQLLLADCRAEGLQRDRIHAFPDLPDRAQLAFPLPGGLMRLVVILASGTEPQMAPGLAPFALPGLRLSDMVWYSAFRISRRQVASMRHGRVLLAGDAAHIHSPAGGQGMNLGMQDAYSLAAALARGGEAAVDAWAAERHAVARRVLRLTDALTRGITGRGPVAALLRGAGLRALMALPFLRRRLTRALAGLDYPPLPD